MIATPNKLSDEIISPVDVTTQKLYLSKPACKKQAAIEIDTQVHDHEHRLRSASQRVRAESMRVNLEFSAIEYAPEA